MDPEKSYDMSEDLLLTGIHHLSSSRTLLDCNNPIFQQSAAYLAYVGIGLMLRSWLVYQTGESERNGSLKSLISKVREMEPRLKLSRKEIETLEFLSKFDVSPYLGLAIEKKIEVESIEDTFNLANSIWLMMPEGLAHLYQRAPKIKKGARILVERPRRLPLHLDFETGSGGGG